MHCPRHSVCASLIVGGARPDGGTDMWSAMLRAAQSLVNRPVGRQQWIVALTDGYSGHSPDGMSDQVARFLDQPAAEPIVILTITVNMADRDRQTIHQVCVEGRNERCGIIAADGGVEALAAAWEEAGERLTVSQKVEQADVSDGECQDLLCEYMQITQRERPWSMMKQVIRVLMRQPCTPTCRLMHDRLCRHIGCGTCIGVAISSDRLLSST